MKNFKLKIVELMHYTTYIVFVNSVCNPKRKGQDCWGLKHSSETVYTRSHNDKRRSHNKRGSGLITPITKHLTLTYQYSNLNISKLVVDGTDPWTLCIIN